MVTQVITAVVYLAIVYALVRPGSPAAGAVQNLANAIVAVVGSATGYNESGGTLL